MPPEGRLRVAGLAFWLATEMPFPTLYRTVASLERRWRPAAMVIVAGLVVPMFHCSTWCSSRGRTSSSAPDSAPRSRQPDHSQRPSRIISLRVSRFADPPLGLANATDPVRLARFLADPESVAAPMTANAHSRQLGLIP